MGTPPFHGLTDEFAGCVGLQLFSQFRFPVRATYKLCPASLAAAYRLFLVDVLLLCFVCPLPVLLMWTPRPAANVHKGLTHTHNLCEICTQYVSLVW